MNLNQTVAPTSEPITWAEVQAHCNIDQETDRAYCEALITAAREYCEQQTGTAMLSQTWTLRLNGFNNDGSVLRDGVIVVPNPPLTSVTSIAYIDTNGVSQTVSASTYTVDTYSRPGKIYLAYDQSWPVARDIENSVTVTYVCGYATAASVPASLRHAVKLMVSHWYATREPIITGTIVADAPMAVESLLAGHYHGYQF